MRNALGLTALVLVRLTLDLSHLLGRPARYWNWEEAYNFTVAWYVWWAGLWGQALDLQAKAFCGGCSVVSALALPGILLGGDELLAWKSVPLVWSAGTLIVGFFAVDRTVGRAAAWAFAVLFAVPPMGVSELGLMAWGNHSESTLFVLLALWAFAAREPLRLGLALGLGLWFCRTSGYAWVLVPMWGIGAWWARRGEGARAAGAPIERPEGGLATPSAALATPSSALATPSAALATPSAGLAAPSAGLAAQSAALLLGLSAALLTLLPAARGDVGTYQMSLTSLLPGPDVVPRLATLLTPLGLGARAWPDGHTSGGWLLAAAALGVLARPNVVVLTLTVLFAFLFGASDFVIPRMGNAAPLLNMRYHAPWLHLLLLLTACGLGGTGWRRWLGVAAVACALVPSGLAHLRTLRADPPEWVGSTPVIDHPHFAAVAIGRLDAERIATAKSPDRRVEATLRRMEGYLAARRVRATRPDAPGSTLEAEAAALTPAGREGLGQALLTDPSQLAAWNARFADLTDVGRGMGWNVGLALLEGRRREPVELGRYSQGLPEGAPCGACVADGFALIANCRGSTSCLDVLETADAEVVYGAGVACRGPGRPRRACEALAERYGPTFAAGLDDAMAGTEGVFR